MADEITIITPKQLANRAENLAQDLANYLTMLTLPTAGVLVKLTERRQVIDNMEAAIEPLDAAKRSASLYISKFVAAAAAGLFDAALNYLWDETIRNLRSKVARFDLSYFFDTVLTDPAVRSKFKDAADLEKLDDWQLVRGCRETGIISDIGFRHLDYVRDMRNFASAAHPNHNELTGLQLVAWLQTCIKEVLGREPEGPVVEVRKLLKSLRDEALSSKDVPPIAKAVEGLPPELARSLTRSCVGMFCDVALPANARKNISLVADAIWAVTPDDGRFEVGLKQATLSANGEAARAKLAKEYLELVDGLTYLPADALAVEMSGVLDTLSAAHDGWNNFHNEAAPARMLRALIPASGAVPKAVLQRYVKTLTMCRIGNGWGVAWSAEATYDAMIATWSSDQARAFLSLVNDSDLSSRLQLEGCAKRFKEIAGTLSKQINSAPLKKALEAIANADDKNVALIGRESRFKTLLAAIKA
jgi:hypothetical protein